MGKEVSLINTFNYDSMDEALFDSINKIDYKLDKDYDKIIIKPNMAYYWKSSTGYTTDPEVVRSIIHYFLDLGVDKSDIIVAEADASAMRTNIAFKLLGYEKMVQEEKVSLMNLAEGDYEKIVETIDGKKISFNLSRTLLNENNIIVNVPKLKIMKIVKVTGSMKNMFGSISNKNKYLYHKNLNQTIVGINKSIKVDLNVMDGIIALGKNPRKMNLIMASQDSFSLDWVAAQIAGYNPSSIGFLKLAKQEGLGTSKGIKIVGDAIDGYQKIFPSDNKAISLDVLWNLQFTLLKLYAKIVNDVIPPFLED